MQHAVSDVKGMACCRFTIDVVATPLSVVHYTVDLDNASCGLTFSADRVAYSGNLLLNHPAPGQLKPGMSAITRKRCTAHPTIRRVGTATPVVICYQKWLQCTCLPRHGRVTEKELLCHWKPLSIGCGCALSMLGNREAPLVILSGLLRRAACLQGAGKDNDCVHADRRASGQRQVPLGRFHSLAHTWRQCPGQRSCIPPASAPSNRRFHTDMLMPSDAC